MLNMRQKKIKFSRFSKAQNFAVVMNDSEK